MSNVINAKGRFAGGPSVKHISIDADIIPLRRKCCKAPFTVACECQYFSLVYWKLSAYKHALIGGAR